jgi:glycosyltransferase involved in cell wall biosynthesis
MKILYVRTFCPNPISYGSEMRSSRLVDYLSKLGDLDLLTLTKPTDQADMSYINEKFKGFFYFDLGVAQDHLNPLEKSFHLLPWQLAQYYSKGVQLKIGEMVENRGYDLIFIHKLHPVLYFLKLSKKWREKTIIDFDDILSDLYFNFYKNPITAQKNSHFLKMYEEKALRQFRRILVCSEKSKSKFPSQYQDKVIVAPNIFNTGKQNFLNPAQGKEQLLFIGSLDYFANLDGMKWFLRHVWPGVKRAKPKLKLAIAGKARETAYHLHSFFGFPRDVEVTVNVPSVHPYYQDCFASIVPLLNGSGTRLKILESAAYGRPVITTLKGMEGLDFRNKKDIFIFSDTRSFIEAYEALLDDATYRHTAQQAFETLERHYSPRVFESNMNKHLGFSHEHQLA